MKQSISRRAFLTMAGTTAASLAIPGRSFSFSADRRPNIVLILIDDLGWADAGCYGSTFHETPNIDNLAAQGVRFTDAYSASPVCAPTRAAIMTGKNPTRMGLDEMLPPGEYRLPLDEVTIAEVLKEAGYATFFTGKWHLGDESHYPDRQGFDINLGGTKMSHPLSGYFSPYNIDALPDGPEGEYLTDRLNNEAVAFIKAHADTPFFLVLSHFAVHTPIEAREELITKYRKKTKKISTDASIEIIDGIATCVVQNNPKYAAMIESVDSGVGMIMDILDTLELSDNTLVIFTSDNGGESNRGNITSNKPLRSGKGWLFEGGIRVPLIVRGPGVTAPGSVSHDMTCSYDLFPTILEAAGLPLMPDLHADGMSLMSVISGRGGIERETLYWNYRNNLGKGFGSSGAIRTGDMKLIHFFESDRVRLYDLAADIGELSDLAGERPEETKRLLAMLEAWRNEFSA